MKNFDDFDSVFYINLDRRPDRRVQAEEELRICGIDRCERFSAIQTTTLPHHGGIGCTASHRHIWRMTSVGQLGDRVLILEDDFQFVTRKLLVEAGYTDASDTMRIFMSVPWETFHERVNFLLPYVPEKWDLLYLGGSYASAPYGRVNQHVIRSSGMHATHSYAITRDFAKILTQMMDDVCPPRDNPEDCHPGATDSILCGDLVSGNKKFFVYTLTPRLFIQRSGTKSDLTHQVGGFSTSMTDPNHEMSV
jgi:hypothetical protein